MQWLILGELQWPMGFPASLRKKFGQNVLLYCTAVVLVPGGVCCTNQQLPSFSRLYTVPGSLMRVIARSRSANGWQVHTTSFFEKMRFFVTTPLIETPPYKLRMLQTSPFYVFSPEDDR